MADRSQNTAIQQNVLVDPEAFFSAPLELIPLDRPLPFSIYIRIADHFVLFRPRGDVLSSSRYQTLIQSIDTMFIPRTFWDTYVDGLLGHNIEDLDIHTEGGMSKMRKIILGYHQVLDKKRVLSPEHIEKFKRLGFRLAEGIGDNPGLGVRLLRRYQDSSLYFVNHSINVAVYSIAVALKLNLDMKDVKMLAFSTLVHNVGNLFVPKEILFKPTSLSREEWDIVRLHPMKGAELLDSLRVPKQVMLTAMQHHERVDGEGYPNQQPGQNIHLFAKICSIADVYDALTNQAPYQRAMVPESAVLKMRHMMGKFDHQILNMISGS